MQLQREIRRGQYGPAICSVHMHNTSSALPPPRTKKQSKTNHDPPRAEAQNRGVQAARLAGGGREFSHVLQADVLLTDALRAGEGSVQFCQHEEDRGLG